MPKLFLFALLMLIAAGSPGQQKELDSLWARLKDHPNEDSTRLVMLKDLAYYYYEVDPGKGLQVAEEAISLAKKLRQDILLAGAYFNKGLNHFGRGEYQEALQMYDLATGIYEKRGDYLKIANVNNSVGVTYQYLSNYPKALETYFKNLRLFEKSGNKNRIAITCSNIGIVYEKLGNYTLSLEYQEKALSIYRQANDQKGVLNALGNIGIVYDDQEKPAKALECYQEALRLSYRIGFPKGIASNLTNMGIAYQSLQNPSDAIRCFERSLPIYTNMNDKKNMSVVLVSMGDLIQTAPENFLQRHGIPASGRNVRSIGYYKRALQLSVGLEDIYAQAEEWEKLAVIYEAQKDFGLALAAYRQHILLRDSIFNDEKKEQVTRMEMQFSFQKKEDSLKAIHEKETALAKAETRRENMVKRAIGWGAGLLIVAALTSFIFYKRKRDAGQLQKEAEFRARVADTEMRALRTQMNPHFIFNSLNSISDYVSRNDTAAASHYLNKFARLMRMILENSELKEVPLSEDLKALELYMQLEALRMDQGFSYDIVVDGDIDPENTLVPPLILQPFVENSIWHGISNMKGKGKILIRIKKEGDLVNCMVEDNGVGRMQSKGPPANQPEEKKPFGIKITRARIDIVNKIKKTKAVVEVSDLAEGTRVEVKLPLELSF